MRVAVESSEPLSSNLDLVAVGLFEGESLPVEFGSEPGASEANGKRGKWTLIHPLQSWTAGAEPRAKRVLALGLGKREEFSAERLRVAAARAAKETRRLGLGSIAWSLPEAFGLDGEACATALVEGTLLADFRFDRLKSTGGDGNGGGAADADGSRAADSDGPDGGDEGAEPIEALTVLCPDESEDALAGVAAAAEAARIAAEAQNRARELQSLPGNYLTPVKLAERAAEIAAAHPDLVADETLGPAEMREKGMGGMLAVGQGSTEEPRLIVLRYSGAGADSAGRSDSGEGAGPTLGLVGKSITFDTGGISLKPPASMHEMKMDMSGGAAVLEAFAAIVEMKPAVNVIAVLPAVENMPSGAAIKPGDVITHYDGTTSEVNNTDAEGRLVLADALTYCIELGADRVVDVATLTGAVVIALGSTYSALITNDSDLAAEVESAGETTGELVWRLPLHEEYRDMIKGKVADLSNASSKRKAGTIYAGAYLEHFVGETPWAHIDIAGTAWDTGRPYLGDGPTGAPTRLLINLATRTA